MAKRLMAVRLSDDSHRKLRVLAEMYGTQTTALEIAIQRLYAQSEGAQPMDETAKARRQQAYDLGVQDGHAAAAGMDDMIGSRALSAIDHSPQVSNEEQSALWLAYYHGRKAGRDEVCT